MDHLLNPKQLASRLGVSTRRVNEMLRQGILPCVRLPNGEVRFRAGDILKWLDELQGVTA